MTKGGGKRATLLLGAIFVIAAAAGAGWWWWAGPRAREESERAIAAELASYERCLLGDADVPTADVPAHLRRVALAGELGAALPEGWPRVCERHSSDAATRLEALSEEPDDALQRLRVALEQVSLSAGSGSGATYPQIGLLIEAIREAPLPDAEATIAVPALPTPVQTMASDRMPILGEAREMFVQRDGAAGLVMQRPDEGATVVTVCGAAPEGVADLRCGPRRRFAGEPSFRLLARAPEGPLLVSNTRGSADDEPLLDARTWSPRGPFLRAGFAREDLTHAVVLQEVGKPSFAIRLPADGAVTRDELEPPFVGAQPVDALVADRSAAVRWEEPGKRQLVRMYRVDEDGRYAAAASLEGAIALRALCPTAEGVFLLRSSNRRSSVDFVPNEGEPVHREVAHGPSPEVRCLPDGVSLLGVRRADDDGARRIVRAQCRRDGCATEEARFELPELLENPYFDALDLGDRVALAWGGGSAPLFVGVAPLAGLADATPEVVADSASHGGPGVSELRLTEHRGDALLVLRGDDAVRAVVIGRDGAARPAVVEAASSESESE